MSAFLTDHVLAVVWARKLQVSARAELQVEVELVCQPAEVFLVQVLQLLSVQARVEKNWLAWWPFLTRRSVPYHFVRDHRFVVHLS